MSANDLPVIPTETLAVVSTGHVPEGEADYLTAGGAERLGGMQRDHGWMLSTRRDVYGCTRLSYVLGYLRGRGFDWVLFDADGEVVDGLDTYDW